MPSIRCRAAPNDLKIAPWRMSVPTATFASKPKNRIRIGVIRLPPPMPVMPTRTPTRSPARENCQVTSGAPRQRAGDERPAGQAAAELVGLATGAEAGGRGEQGERGDEQRRARRPSVGEARRVGERRRREHDEADHVRGPRRARVLERPLAEARLDELEVGEARQAEAAPEREPERELERRAARAATTSRSRRRAARATPITAWLKRGARESITVRSR